MGDKILENLLTHDRDVEEAVRKGQAGAKINELIEIRRALQQIREQRSPPTDLTPIIERLERMEGWLVKILDKVDLTEEEQELIRMMRMEMEKG